MSFSKNKFLIAGLFFVFLLVVLWGIVFLQNNYANKPSAAVKNDSNKNQEISVKLIISFDGSNKEFNRKVLSGSTVFDLLYKISQENNFSLAYQEFDMGVFVDEIDGTQNDEIAQKYWLYKVNGQLATIGASSYVLKDNDIVEWFFGEAEDYIQ